MPLLERQEERKNAWQYRFLCLAVCLVVLSTFCLKVSHIGHNINPDAHNNALERDLTLEEVERWLHSQGLNVEEEVVEFIGEDIEENDSEENFNFPSTEPTPQPTIYDPCYWLSQESVIFICHHRSGCRLVEKLSTVINSFCEKEIVKTKRVMDLLINRVLMGELASGRLMNTKKKFYWFHFNREPVNTIISGFNYHAYYDTTQQFIFSPMHKYNYEPYGKTVYEIKNNLLSLIDTNRNSLNEIDWQIVNSYIVDRLAYSDFANQKAFRRYEQCLWLPQNQTKDMNIKITNMRIKAAIQNKKTLRQLYRSDDESITLNYELIRYSNCEWMEYVFIKSIAQKLTNEYFMEYYDLNKNNFNHLVQDLLRKTGMSSLLDIHDVQQLNKDLTNLYQNPNFTRSDYNSTQQVSHLLEKIQQCNLAKRLTQSLEIEWKYQQFC